MAFTALRAVCLRELEVADQDWALPADGAGDLGLPVVGVRVQVALQATDLYAIQVARDVRLVVVPAHLSVGHDVHAGIDLLADDFDGHLILDAGEIIVRDLASVSLVDGDAEARGTGPVGDLGVVAHDGCLHSVTRFRPSFGDGTEPAGTSSRRETAWPRRTATRGVQPGGETAVRCLKTGAAGHRRM
jgi:hypothetical protein